MFYNITYLTIRKEKIMKISVTPSKLMRIVIINYIYLLSLLENMIYTNNKVDEGGWVVWQPPRLNL